MTSHIAGSRRWRPRLTEELQRGTGRVFYSISKPEELSAVRLARRERQLQRRRGGLACPQRSFWRSE